MIPRRPTESEIKWAHQVRRMVNDGWSYVHSADVAEARDILVRKVRWETAANFGAAVIVLAVVTLALVVWL